MDDNLNFEHQSLVDADTKMITNPLKTHQTLQTLSLFSNRFTSKGLSPILKAVSNHPCITTLNLGYNLLDLSAVPCLCALIESNTNLSVLELDENGINDEGVTQLLNSLKNNYYITQLSLDGNPGFDSDKRLDGILDRNRQLEQTRKRDIGRMLGYRSVLIALDIPYELKLLILRHLTMGDESAGELYLPLSMFRIVSKVLLDRRFFGFMGHGEYTRSALVHASLRSARGMTVEQKAGKMGESMVEKGWKRWSSFAETVDQSMETLAEYNGGGRWMPDWFGAGTAVTMPSWWDEAEQDNIRMYSY